MKHADEPAWRQLLRSLGVWTWFVVYIGLLPAALSVALFSVWWPNLPKATPEAPAIK